MNTKKMIVNPRVIEHLGSELITSSSVALVELIKNSLDAKSKAVNIQIFDNANLINKKDTFLDPLNNSVVELLMEEANDKAIILIEDQGIGMDENQIDEGFLNIGTDIKYKDESKAYLGEKGIGRLAAQRLGQILILETASINEKKSNVVVINWNRLIKSKNIENIDLPFFQFEKVRSNGDIVESYTRLWIIGIDKNEIINEPEQISLFKNNKITLNEDLDSTSSFLISPFYGSRTIPQINYYKNGEKIEFTLDMDILELSESMHTFKIDRESNHIILDLELNITPQYIEKTHRSCFKPISNFPKYRKEMEDYIFYYEKYREWYTKSLNIRVTYEELISKIKEIRKKAYADIEDEEGLDNYLIEKVKGDLEKLKVILPISGNVYSFKQDNAVGKMYIDFVKKQKIKSCDESLIKDYSVLDIQNFLKKYNGIKLYRNNYRIGTLGNKGDDWLQMQQFRTSGQQFYRMNQGNITGYVKINDPRQKYIKEVSSRLDIVENSVSNIFKEMVIIIFNYYFYDFNKRADEITKSFLREEGLLPDDLKNEVKKRKNKSKKLIEENKKLLKEITKTRQLLSSAIIDGDKVNLSQSVYNMALNTLDATKTQMETTQGELNKTQEVLDTAEAGLKQIEVEAFNNYKLMANGLITETITHELDSIINDKHMFSIESKFDVLKTYLYENNISMYSGYLLPIKDQNDLLLNKVGNIADLYKFLEKTFIKKNNYDEYSTENLMVVVTTVENKLEKELKKNRIKIEKSGLKQHWYMPKGVLLHVFYNLFSNSIYWIDIRKKRKIGNRSGLLDNINIEQKSDSEIWVYDTGIGIISKMEYILFEALESGKESGGRGMGLYIVKKLLNSFKADIELMEERNEYGNRYIFSITVPDECIR